MRNTYKIEFMQHLFYSHIYTFKCTYICLLEEGKSKFPPQLYFQMFSNIQSFLQKLIFAHSLYDLSTHTYVKVYICAYKESGQQAECLVVFVVHMFLIPNIVVGVDV